jgi:hypothetical protein
MGVRVNDHIFGSTVHDSSFVMAGLVPAIHVFVVGQDVDARHKAGHDGGR